MLSKRILTGKILLDQFLIHDDKFVVFETLIVREKTTPQDRDSHRRKIARVGRSIRDKMMLARCLSGMLWNPYLVIAIVSATRDYVRQPSGLDAGKMAYSVQKLGVETQNPLRFGVLISA
jgi:hypothetical protein